MSVREWRILIKQAFINRTDKSDTPNINSNININKGKNFSMTEKKRNHLLDMLNKDKLRNK